MSMKSIYEASKSMTSLIDVLLTTVGKTKKVKNCDENPYNMHKMTNGEAFDNKYGKAIDRITKLVQEKGRFVKINAADYPEIWDTTV